MKATIAALIFSLSLASVAPPAVAAQDEVARQHFRTGRAYFERADYRNALLEFEQAFALSGNDTLLYNIAQCQYRVGSYRDAVVMMERFLATDAADAQREEAAEQLEEWRVLADQRDAEQATEVVEEESDVDPDTDEADVEPDTDETTERDVAVLEAPVVPRTADDPRGLNVPALAAFVVGGVGLATFGTFGALALAEDRDLAQTCGADTTRTCSDDAVSSLRTKSVVADIGLGVAVVGVTLGVIFWVTGRDRAEAEVAIAPAVGRGFAGLSAGGRF